MDTRLSPFCGRPLCLSPRPRARAVGASVTSLLLLASCSGGGGGEDDAAALVPAANLAPTVAVTNANQTAQVGYGFDYDANQGGTTFSDGDGDPLVISVSYDPASHGLSDAFGRITGVPDQAGDIVVTIRATDPSGASAEDILMISVGIDQDAIATAFGGAIDLSALPNYAGQAVPSHITKFNDGGNPVTSAGATLGRVLFYDTALSVDDTVSCASCHAQARAFSDPAVVSGGVSAGVTRRHSMRLINTAFADEDAFFWDERAASHEVQETQPIQDHNELGFSGVGGRGDLNDLIAKLEAIEYYEELFRFVFLDPEITEARLQLALAQFTKSIHSFDSKFDVGLAAAGGLNQPFANFTATENNGKALFLAPPNQGGAGCQGCHRAPEFDIAPQSGHNGVIGEANDPLGFDLTNTRAPTLRDLVDPSGASNGPFMHDGSLATLGAVINHYNAIQAPANEPPRAEFLATIDPRLLPGGNPQRLNLTATERAELEAFLRTLSGSAVYTDAKYANPFP